MFKYVMVRSVFSMPSLGINNCLQTPWHRLVETLKVAGGDLVPNPHGDLSKAGHGRSSFCTLEVFHLAPKILDWIDVQAVAWPTLEQLDAVSSMPRPPCKLVMDETDSAII